MEEKLRRLWSEARRLKAALDAAPGPERNAAWAAYDNARRRALLLGAEAPVNLAITGWPGDVVDGLLVVYRVDSPYGSIGAGHPRIRAIPAV